MLTSVAFLILSFVTPWDSHTALTMNQNWSRSSFPTPLNTGSLITLTILNYGGGGCGVGGDGGEGGEAVVVWVEVVTAECDALSN